jgi:hypothetical protein
MERPIRVGVVGLRRGMNFAQQAGPLLGMELAALCDAWEERLEKAAENLVAIRDQWKVNLDLFREMAQVEISQHESELAFRRICGIPDDKSTALLAPQTIRRLNRLDDLYHNGPGRKGANLWDVYSAVTCYNRERPVQKGNTRIEATWWGTGLQMEAAAKRVCRQMIKGKSPLENQ